MKNNCKLYNIIFIKYFIVLSKVLKQLFVSKMSSKRCPLSITEQDVGSVEEQSPVCFRELLF